MVKGLSFQKGILFIGKKYVSCTYEENGLLKSWLKPLSLSTYLLIGKLVFFSMPLWYYIFCSIWIIAIVFHEFGLAGAVGLPHFTIIYFFFGTHFWFPNELKKYHGAEHKVFSYRGIISTRNKQEIKEAKITNRFCSTNSVLLFFLLVPMITAVIIGFQRINFVVALEYATYISVLLWPLATYWLNRMKLTNVKKVLLSMSYWLQKHITTTDPEDKHIRTAIRSYRRLALKEFSYRVRHRKEERKMAIADITVIPLGANTTSVSPVVAEIHRLLKETDKNIYVQLTPMSTLIEGDIEDLLHMVREIHEVPFKLGYKRVATNIRIDDRRDKPSSMKGKVEAVNQQIELAKKNE
ncbi:MTH1187 family thiamine-binding protein [Evansella halocellulosilytica]|uniref:MTH1187 family thiamine-binding protein n=1 Tax=Evansella halocellulosilytica TaxID=2011013 RepID=UPI000BB71601|nr:MTH1187 family thiamine-binding protein [Evansella halocellulosilytica]